MNANYAKGMFFSRRYASDWSKWRFVAQATVRDAVASLQPAFAARLLGELDSLMAIPCRRSRRQWRRLQLQVLDLHHRVVLVQDADDRARANPEAADRIKRHLYAVCAEPLGGELRG
jgi:hypothetical protein